MNTIVATKPRLAALVGVGTLSLMTIMGAGTAAVALPQAYGNIDTDHSASLTVHKFLHQAGSHAGDISEEPDSGDFADPVENVEFTAYPLHDVNGPVDLGDPTSWSGIDSLQPGASCTAPAGYTLGSPIVMPLTGADGSATQALSVGLYQVCETDAPAQFVDRALPFILTLPQPLDNGWVYDVHAYPKNGVATIEKSIEAQDGLGLGSEVLFPVEVEIPTMAANWSGFAVRDTLDSRFSPAANGVLAVTLDGVEFDEALYNVAQDGNEITVEFTAAGIAWLNEKTHAGQVLEVVFSGTVEGIAGDGTTVDGVIPNQAQLWVNNPSYDTADNEPVVSGEVATNWGTLEVLKRAAGTSDAEGLLEGATFQVYAADDPYAADCSVVSAAGDPIDVGGATEFTSDASGVIFVAGLFVSDSVNPSIDAAERCYVLREVAAPAGYVLPTDADFAVAVQIGATETADNAEIENTQASVAQLPLTGAAGQIILLAIGAVALLAGVALVAARRRQESAARAEVDETL